MVDGLLGDTRLEDFGDRWYDDLALPLAALFELTPWLSLHVARTPVAGVLVEKSYSREVGLISIP